MKTKKCRKRLSIVQLKRHLLSLGKKIQAKKKMYWDGVIKQKFEEPKITICRLAKEGLMYYEKSRSTVAVTD